MATSTPSSDAVPDQPGLFLVEPSEKTPKRKGRRPSGRHERALSTALKAIGLSGKDADPLKVAKSAAGVSLARALAHQIDEAEDDRRGIYAMPQLAAQYRDALAALGLLDDQEGGDGDPLAGVGQAALVNPEDS